MPVPNTFANATTSIPLSQLDANFATPITLGNTAIQLGNTVTTLNNMTLSNVTITTGNVTVSNATVSGNLAFTGTGNRITGDFSNTTVPNRVAFQTSTVNGNTIINAIPNGTGTNADFRSFNNSDPTNAAFFQVGMASAGGEARLNSGISGAGTYVPMTFVTGGSERMRIDASGNVGIGTSSPGTKLDVVGGIWSHPGGSVGALAELTADATSGANGISISASFASGGFGPIRLLTSATERMRIDTAGNVGIGTSSPRARSNVNGGSGAPSLSADTNNIALTTSATSVELAEGAYPGSPFAYWMQVKQSTNSGAAWPLAINPLGGNVGIGTSSPNFNGVTGTVCHINNSAASSWALSHYTNGTTGAGGADGFIVGLVGDGSNAYIFNYEVADILFGTSGGERARITSSGDLLVNTTTSRAKLTVKSASADSYNVGGLSLERASSTNRWNILPASTNDLYFGYNEADRAYIRNTDGAFISVSDRSAKKNIENISYGLSAVMALRSCSYNMSSDEEGSRKSLGFIAQEVLSVVPESVFEMQGGMYGMDKSSIIPVLVKAIQEQQAQIEELKARVAALENK